MKNYIFLIIIVFPLLVFSQTNQRKSEYRYGLRPYFLIDASSNLSLGTRVSKYSSYYGIETGFGFTFSRIKLPHDKEIRWGAIAGYKKLHTGIPLYSAYYEAEYINLGLFATFELIVKKWLSIEVSNETMINNQISLKQSKPIQSHIVAERIKAFQSKMGVGVAFHPLKNISISLNAKIAPCIQIGGFTNISSSHPKIQYNIIDSGWPIYLGTALEYRFK